MESPTLPRLLCAAMAVMWSQISQATASTQSPNIATFNTLSVSSVLFTEDVLWEKPARSEVECAVMCRRDARCLMITFSPGAVGSAGSCRTYKKRHTPQGQKVSMAGARTFSLNPGDWIQKACSSSSDCTEPQSACYSGQCLCDGGYFFDPTEKACVKNCSRGLGNQYLDYKNMDLLGHDQYFDHNVNDPKTCYPRCNADPKCVLIVHAKVKCHYKHVTAQDVPTAWKPLNGASSLQRTCA